MSYALDERDPYAASMSGFAADAELSERLAFLRRVYGHVFGAILLLVGLEFVYFTTPIGGMIFQVFGSLWWIALLGFMGVCWFAQRLAFSGASPGMQYLGLGLYVLAESVFIAPAIGFALISNPDLIGQAAFLTVLITGALTLFVVLSKQDFSFLRGALFIGTFGLLALAVCSWIFGFHIGIAFSVGVVLLMCGYILYETSLIMKHLPTTAHVAGALMIFGSMAELFRHLIYILSYLNDD